MPDISQVTFQGNPGEEMQASGERRDVRPDLRDVPENPPVDEQDLERGREKLERVLAK